MSEETKVATENVTDAAPKVMVMTDDPATAQQVEAFQQITDLGQAASFLELPDEYEVTDLLVQFEKRIHAAIDSKKTKLLKPLTDAKNILLRHIVETQVKNTGKFDFTDVIPFETACTSCRGTGELYKFFRNTVTEPCKFCNNGYVLITCRSCKGSTRYKKNQHDLKIDVECSQCERDENDKPTGQEKVKCRKCRGTAKFRSHPIAPKIESTTHCHDCKGRGFTLPEPEKKSKTNTAMAAAMEKAEKKSGKNLGYAVKTADVKE